MELKNDSNRLQKKHRTTTFACLSRFLLLVPALLAYGCATSQTSLSVPCKEDMAKPVETLRQNYPDLEKYDLAFRRRTPFNMGNNMAYMDDLVRKWGEPTESRLTWYSWIPVVLIWNPTKEWLWQFGDNEARAVVGHPMYIGYQAELMSLGIRKRKP